MNKRIQATPACRFNDPLRSRYSATYLLVLVLLGGLPVWSPMRADAQFFQINHIPNQTVLTNTPITPIQVLVTDQTIPAAALGYLLLPGLTTTDATNAIISTTGLIQWTPTEAQVVSFSVVVTDKRVGGFQTSTNFTVTVTNAATPVGQVVIDTIPPQTITEGTTLIFTNSAHATDNPTNALVFGLLNAPSGATLTNNSPTSGVFTWTPTAAQAVTPSYTIREVVTEVSTSSNSFQDFQVTVTRTNDCAQLDAFLAAVQQGGYFLLSNCTTIVLTNTLTISNNLTLDAGASSVTIAGNNLSRLFTVLPGVTNFTLRGITLSGGQDVSGGGLYISQGAVAVLTNCTFVGNRAMGADGSAGADGSSGGGDGGNGGAGTGGGTGFGGAIYNLGSLGVLGCQFLTNSAVGGSGGAGGGGGNGSGTLSHGGDGGGGGYGAPAQGGAIYSAGSLLLSNCTFTGNGATGGSGGLGGTNGTGRFAGNAGTGGAGSEGSGAAVYSANYAVILNCTFSGNIGQGGNSASGGTDSNGDGVSGASGGSSLGGGVYNLNTGFLTNCTFSGNQVTGGTGGDGGTGTGTLASGGNGGNGGNAFGGGLYNAGSMAVVNCTFSGCGSVGGTNGLSGSGRFAGTDGSMGLGLGGDIAQGSGAFLLQNSILATNSAGGNAYASSTGGITDGGYNLSSDATPGLSGTSLNNTDPLLTSTLADNGGPTMTLAFLTNTSPAINKIPPSAGPATDQRGILRPQPQGGLSDIGAYELIPVAAFMTQPQSQTVAVGGSATFTVSVYPTPLSYQWRFNVTNLIAGAVAASYTISSATTTNDGNYDVVVGNSAGSVTSAVATLTVFGPPTIVTQPSNQTSVVGGNASFNVTASSTSPLAYQWRLNGTSIPGATLPAYAVSGVQPSAAAVYDVIVANNYGSVTSLTAVLSAFINGRITQGGNGLPGVKVAVGTNVSLTDAGGYYTNLNLREGANVLVTPSLTGYAFAPASQPLPQSATISGLSFRAFPTLALTRSTNGSPQLAFTAAFTCGVQASTDLKNWQVVFATNTVLADTQILQFTDTNGTALPTRFYRFAEAFAGLPVLTNWAAASSTASLDGIAFPIQDCQIEVSTDLKNWTPVFTNSFLPNAAPFQFRFSEGSSNSPGRFYRVFQTPGF